MTDILMPALSPTMEEGTLTKWHIKAGDTVSAGQVIAEIETDKATMEVEAVDEGEVLEILVPEGSENVKVNTPIARLAGEDAAPAPAPKAEAAPAPSGSCGGSDHRERDGRGIALLRGGTETIFGSEDTLGRIHRGCLRAEHARSVRAALEHGGTARQLRRCEPQGGGLSRVDDQPDDGFTVGGGRESVRHGLADCLGVKIPPPPRRASVGDVRDDDVCDLLDLVEWEIIGAQQCLVRARLDELTRPPGGVTAEEGGRPPPPPRGEVAERVQFFRGTSLESRLLADVP